MRASVGILVRPGGLSCSQDHGAATCSNLPVIVLICLCTVSTRVRQGEIIGGTPGLLIGADDVSCRPRCSSRLLGGHDAVVHRDSPATTCSIGRRDIQDGAENGCHQDGEDANQRILPFICVRRSPLKLLDL